MSLDELNRVCLDLRLDEDIQNALDSCNGDCQFPPYKPMLDPSALDGYVEDLDLEDRERIEAKLHHFALSIVLAYMGTKGTESLCYWFQENYAFIGQCMWLHVFAVKRRLIAASNNPENMDELTVRNIPSCLMRLFHLRTQLVNDHAPNYTSWPDVINIPEHEKSLFFHRYTQ